jgi:putative spermidine/putrescine transport system ATP-binding protein
VLDGQAALQLTGHLSGMLRPERIQLGEARDAKVSGVVTEVQYFGSFTRIKVSILNSVLQADLPEGLGVTAPETGATVHLHWDDRAVHALTAAATI